jgi:hypothetical protein
MRAEHQERDGGLAHLSSRRWFHGDGHLSRHAGAAM